MTEILKGYFSCFHLSKQTFDRNLYMRFSKEPRPFYILSTFLEGKGKIHFEGKDLSLQTHDVFFIPKGAVYDGDWIANPKQTVFSLYFDYPPLLDPFKGKKLEIQKIDALKSEDITPYLERLRTNSTNNNIYPLLSDFFALFDIIQSKLIVQKKNSFLQKIQPALDYIEKNYSEKISVQSLADLCLCSISGFFSAFKTATGSSPIQYKNLVCISYVQQSLIFEKNKSIEEIATEYGFESITYFRKLFHKITGKKPKEFRNGQY